MTIDLNNKVTLNNTMGRCTHKTCKPVINLDTGDIYASTIDAAEILGCSESNISLCCLGKTRTCKGYHLAYASRVSENINALTSRIRTMHAQQTELQHKASAWDANKGILESANRTIDELTKSINNANDELSAYRAYKEQKAKVKELDVTITRLRDELLEATEAHNAAVAVLVELEKAL